MEQGFARNNAMIPGRLVWMTDNVAFQIPEVIARLVKKSVSVPRRRVEIPEVCDYKEQNPEQKERGFWLYQGSEAGGQGTGLWEEGAKQEEYAKQPPHWLPHISPS